jgi:predicted PurR-regulated permease PerM
MDITDIQPSQTGAGIAAGLASKGMTVGAATGVLGWLTSDAMVGLIGLAVAVLGLLVTTLFRYLDSRTLRRESNRRLAQLDAQDARDIELHKLQVAQLQASLSVNLKDAAGAVDAGRPVAGVQQP